MTMPAYNSFELYKGDTLRFSLTLQTSGSAYIIPSGTIFTGAVKKKGGATPIVQFNSNIISASTGKVLFTLTSENSTLLDASKNWIYDIQMMNSSSLVTTLLTGNIFVTDEVTL